MFTQSVSFSAAFIAGLLSFLSPCVLPLIPAYFTFITGLSLEQLTAENNARLRMQIFLSTLAYVCGFSTVFILLGASATFMGNVVSQYSGIIRIGGGLLIIIFGLHLTGWIKLPFLQFEKRVHLNQKPVHLLGVFVIGMAFGAGWSPCIGPLLGSILIIASNQDTLWQGVGLLAVYSAGLAIPFLLISAFIQMVFVFLKKITRYMRYINLAAGVLLILVGLSLITNKLAL